MSQHFSGELIKFELIGKGEFKSVRKSSKRQIDRKISGKKNNRAPR